MEQSTKMASSERKPESVPRQSRDEPHGYIGRSLVFYAQFHQHPVNIAIHVVFVPIIIFASIVLLSYLPSLRILKEGDEPDGFPSWLEKSLRVSPGSLLLLAYSWLYASFDPIAGLSWATITGIPLLLLANYTRSKVEMAWLWAIGLQLVSWYMQIHPGHLLIEKRKPALVDSVADAFITGPLFVWLDVLFMLGYRPGLKAAVNARASEARKDTLNVQATSRAKVA